MNKRTILITGASGFLGSWLADECINAGYDIIGVDIHAPLKPQIWSMFATASCETVDFSELLKDIQMHAVCHLAGGASVASSVNNPFGDFSSLLPGTARLALFLTKHHPETHLLLFSSAAVYGNPELLPISEKTPILPISPYGIHKAVAEDLLENYSRIFGLNVTVFRIFSVFGPGLRKQLIWDVGQKALTAAKRNERTITLFGTGQESRDFIYVKDLCSAVLTVINCVKKLKRFEIYNLASGQESTILETSLSLIHHLKLNIDVQFDGSVPKGDPVNWRADISLLKKMGFVPKYNMDKALEEVAQWLRSIS